MVRSQKGGMVEKRVGPQERRGKNAKARSLTHSFAHSLAQSLARKRYGSLLASLHFDRVPEGRNDTEKGGTLGETKEER